MSTPFEQPPAQHPTERERAIKAAMLGLVLGAFLRLVTRAR
jgi:hypothetical protein